MRGGYPEPAAGPEEPRKGTKTTCKTIWVPQEQRNFENPRKTNIFPIEPDEQHAPQPKQAVQLDLEGRLAKKKARARNFFRKQRGLTQRKRL